MPKYLIKASYTAEGVAGLKRDGGTGRVEAVTTLMEGLGGSLESFYFAFGGADAYVVVDAPDNETAAAVAMTVNGSGAVRSETIVLLTPEEVDAAVSKSVSYRPPGG